jgi:hypothetical protein
MTWIFFKHSLYNHTRLLTLTQTKQSCGLPNPLKLTMICDICVLTQNL